MFLSASSLCLLFHLAPELLRLYRQDVVQVVAVPPILEVAGVGPVAVFAEAVVLIVAAGVRVDVAVPDLPGDLVEQPLHILPQPPKLIGGGQGAGHVPLPVYPHR